MIYKRMLVNIVSLALFSIFISSCMRPTSNYPQLEKGEIELERKKEEEAAYAEKSRKEKVSAQKLTEFEERLKLVGGKIQIGGTQLCNNMKQAKNNCLYDFYILQEKGAKAFADGNKIHLTETMMRFAKEDEDLAIVLGHEYAHNIMGHISAKKTHAIIGTILGMAVDIAVGSQGVDTYSAFSNVGKKQGATSFSQEYEKEADYVGLYITALAGYDISNAPAFWRRMSLKNPQSIYIGTTHPTSPERYLALEKTVAEIKRKENNGAILMPDFKD